MVFKVAAHVKGLFWQGRVGRKVASLLLFHGRYMFDCDGFVFPDEEGDRRGNSLS